ncbi:MAG: DUF3822 family protein [Bacteroidales bacterium]|jgi:hypothetical protein|nr:DUF3822 family protein [Bacteroidales bacterium]
MQNIAFVDETLDINLTQSYHLSIQADLNGLSFCILDPVRNKYIALEHHNFKENQLFEDYLNELEIFINHHNLLSKPFKRVKLIWLSRKNALIPDSFFDKDRLKPVLELTQPLDELDEIHFQPLKYNDIISTFVVPNLLSNLLIRKFPGIAFYNQQIPLINHIIQNHHTEKAMGFINIQHDFFEFVVTNKGQVLFYNNFKRTTDAEMAYFVLYALEQNQLNKNTLEMVLSGMIEKHSSLFQTLKKFIKNITFDHRPEGYTYSYTFNKIPQHTFTNLFNIVHCES